MRLLFGEQLKSLEVVKIKSNKILRIILSCNTVVAKSLGPPLEIRFRQQVGHLIVNKHMNSVYY